MSFLVDVNPAVLGWARGSAGYSVPDAAKRLGVSEKTLEEWETGQLRPTWSGLCGLAKLYSRPLASLLLASPPQDAPGPADYRRLPDAKKELSPKARLVIRTARWLARTASELESQLGIDTLPGVPSISLSDDPERIAQDFRARLDIAITEQTSWTTYHQALRQWRARIEAQHVFVFQFRMPLKEVRGFSLIEQQRPVIVLNQADAVSARIFTLCHEYAHLVIANPGVCLPEHSLLAESHLVEAFCNHLAAALLIPRADLEQRLPSVARDKAIAQLARRYRVSRYVVLGRMYTLRAISRETYQQITRRWQTGEQPPPARATKHTGGPGRAERCLNQRGRLFVSLVMQAAKSEHIAANDATGYLGVHLNDLRKLALKVR